MLTATVLNVLFLGALLYAVAVDAQVLPGTARGQYCGCTKTRGRCLRQGKTDTECFYSDCDIYKCDAVQTDTPELICLQKVSPTTLTATGDANPKSDAPVACVKIPVGSTFLTLYAKGIHGERVDWPATARQSLIVRLAKIGNANSQVQVFASAIAKFLDNPADPEAGSVIRSASAILAAQTGNNQDLLALDANRATLAETVNRMKM